MAEQYLQELRAVGGEAKAPGPSSDGADQRPDQNVVWRRFQTAGAGPDARLFLVIGLVSGFRVFEVDSSRRRLVQVADSSDPGPIGSVDVLVREGGAGAGGELLLLVRSADNRAAFPRSCVKVYSPDSRKFVHVLRLRSDVIGIATAHGTGAAFAVHTRTAIHVYNTRDYRLVHAVSCMPAEAAPARPPFALGAAWLAFQGGAAPLNPPRASESSLSLRVPSISAVKKKPTATLSSLSNDFMSGLYSIGSRGVGSLKSYWTGGPGGSQAAAPREALGARRAAGAASAAGAAGAAGAADGPRADIARDGDGGGVAASRGTASSGGGHSEGFVTVLDIPGRRALCRFRAHSTRVTYMAFDPSGLLLVTAGTTGQHLKVWSLLDTRATGGACRPRLFRRLFRGIRFASISAVEITPDARLAAVSTDNGTTHMYSLGDRGAVAQESDAARRVGRALGNGGAAADDDDEARSVAVSPELRIRVGGASASISKMLSGAAASLSRDTSADSAGSPPAAAAFFRSNISPGGTASWGVAVASGLGAEVTLYNLDQGSEAVAISSESQVVLRASTRRGAAGVVRAHESAPAEKKKPLAKGPKEWLAHVETVTYQSNQVPVWASPQFTLQAARQVDNGALARSPDYLFWEDTQFENLAYKKYGTFSGLRVAPLGYAAEQSLEARIASATGRSILERKG